VVRLTAPPIVGAVLLGLDELGAGSTAKRRAREALSEARLAGAGDAEMARIELDGVSKVFAGEVMAVDDLSLSIEDGEFMVLVGPSGCGKSTVLRLVAGLEEVTDGEIRIGDRDVTDLRPKERDIAMVFQNYALYPHMTVRENIEFGLKLRRTPKAERDRRVLEAARILELEPLLERRPAALSGGQRQRVAMGRAMVREPQAFLMDEPLSNLDAKLRVQMRTQLARLRDRLETTTIYVTHDQVEAMTLGDRVAVLRDGVLQQVDTPQTLFGAPANLFVAAFIGSPSMNLVHATIEGGAAAFAGYRVPLPSARAWPTSTAVESSWEFGPPTSRTRTCGATAGCRRSR
jgi:multiple sugar transport system ATP-binding protein